MTYDTVPDELCLCYMKLFLKAKNLLNMEKTHRGCGNCLWRTEQVSAPVLKTKEFRSAADIFIVAISFFCCNTGDEILGLWMLCKFLVYWDRVSLCSLDQPQIHHPFVCLLNAGIAKYPGQVIYSFPSSFPGKGTVASKDRGSTASPVTCQRTYCESRHVSENILWVPSCVRGYTANPITCQRKDSTPVILTRCFSPSTQSSLTAQSVQEPSSSYH